MTATQRHGLELRSFDVTGIEPSEDPTALAGGVLRVNLQALEEEVLRDSILEGVTISIVGPGEDARIVHVLDAVEPRVRLPEPSPNFPGLLDAPVTVGRGTTNRLAGTSVVVTSEAVAGESTYWREAIVDMQGPGAPYTPLSPLWNVVLSFDPARHYPPAARAGEQIDNLFEGSRSAVAYFKALRVAALRAAVHLARATIGATPDSTLPLPLPGRRSGTLPRVVYMLQLATPYVYGEIAPAGGGVGQGPHLPTLISPAEILDGAIVNGWAWAASARDLTWCMQNHPLILELYGRHGRDLDFAGVVLFTSADSVSGKQRLANYAAGLAELLGADGAILTSTGGGHPVIDVMTTCQELERRGIRTTLILMEMAANPGESGFVHFVPEADAIVSTGNYEAAVELPAVTRVIGGERIFETGQDTDGPLELTLRYLLSATTEFGWVRLRGRES